MHRTVGAKALRFVLLLSLVLVFLPLEAGAYKGAEDEEPTYTNVYYFPLMYRDTTLVPDLVVESITVNSDSAVVVIKNQGTDPVNLVNSFWVDLYVDPASMPAGPNETWDQFGLQGIAWLVWSKGLPLQPGKTLTLSYCPEWEEQDPFYWDEYSHFVETLNPNTRIAVQVDSAGVGKTYGEVLEDHEILDTAYNNISVTLSIAGSGCEVSPTLSSGDLLPISRSNGMPARPGHAE